MAHKNCLQKANSITRCDCINDNITELEVIKNNIRNIEKLLKCYLKTQNEIDIKDFSNYLKLRLRIENEN